MLAARTGPLDEAESWLQLGQAIARRISPDAFDFEVAFSRAHVALERGEHGAALEDIERALAVALRRRDERAELRARTSFALILAQRELTSESLTQLDLADGLARRLLSGPHPALALLLHYRAHLYLRRELLHSALDLEHRALRIYRTLDHRPGVARSLDGLGKVLRHLGRPDEALEASDSAVAIMQELPAVRPEEIATFIDARAVIAAQLGRHERATADFARVLTILEETHRTSSQRVVAARLRLARSYFDMDLAHRGIEFARPGPARRSRE